jgi:hypothetical protein
MYFYKFLDELEIFEWVARVADNFFHITYSSIKVFKDHDLYKKKYSVLPLELKIHELMTGYFAPLLDMEVGNLRDMNLD